MNTTLGHTVGKVRRLFTPTGASMRRLLKKRLALAPPRSESPFSRYATRSAAKRGYTLLEMIVAVGIFSVVMLAATGAYLTLINLDRQARAMNDVVSNLTFAVDSMSRAVRTGTNYKCNNVSGTNCTNGSTNSSLGFTDSESPNRGIVYSLSNTGPNAGQIMATICSPAPCAGGTASALTDPRISVQSLKFYVRGVGVGDGIQPQVTFTIAGLITTGVGKSVNFSIEGGATQRLLEI